MQAFIVALIAIIKLMKRQLLNFLPRQIKNNNYVKFEKINNLNISCENTCENTCDLSYAEESNSENSNR